MKKYFLLTSLFALAACGGGGGHSGSSAIVIPDDITYTAPRAAVTSEIAESNSGITGMSSEIVVASNRTTPVSIIREAKSTKDGITYVSYRLDDVKLYTAQTLGEDTTYLNLNIDEKTGEIDAIKMYMGSVDSGYIIRTKNGDRFENTFNGPIFEYVPDDDDRALFRVADTGQDMGDLNVLAEKNNLSGGHWNRVDEQMVFKTYGKDNGLKYADFGYFNPVSKSKNKELNEDVIAAVRQGKEAIDALARGEDKDKMYTEEQIQKALVSKDYQLFAGGYAIDGTVLKDTLDVPANATFQGTAIGRVSVSIKSTQDGVEKSDALNYWGVPYDNAGKDGYTNEAGHDIANLYVTNNATLKVDSSGNKILNMPFNTNAADGSDKFYDIKISYNGTDDVTNVKFTGNENLIDNQYREHGALGLDEEGNVNMDNINQANFTSGFYGVNTVEETAGAAHIRTEDVPYSEDNRIQREYGVQAAWGMTKQ